MGRLFRIAISGIGLALLLKILNDLDVNKVVFSHQPGPCKVVPGIDHGSEDIIVLSNGLAIISSGAFIGAASDNQPGALYVYDLGEFHEPPKDSQHSPRPVGLTKLKIVGHPDLETFYPTGIAAWEGTSPMNPTLYVVNSFKHCIEVYTIDLPTGNAQYKRNIRDPSFKMLNNLVMVGPNKFYATNFLYYTHPALNAVEMFLQLPFGSVIYYDGSKGHEVISGLQGPNGVALSRGSKHLYVALNLAEKLNTYFIKEAKTADGGMEPLELLQSTELTTGPDNLFVDVEDGAVWTGAHPIAFQIITHLFDSRKYAAPSQVIKIHPETGRMTEVFGDDGTTLQAATAAVKYGNKLLIGTVRHKLMQCTLLHH